MLLFIVSFGMFFGDIPLNDSYQLLHHSEQTFSAKMDHQTVHYTINSELDAKILRFENQKRFLEVVYFGQRQLKRIKLRTNFSGELVSHSFLVRQDALLGTEDAWDFVALIEPEGEALFEAWSSIKNQEEMRMTKSIESNLVVRRDPLEVSCTGLTAFGIGGDRSAAQENMHRNCDNGCCLGCCKVFGCSKISFFFWRCSGRACDLKDAIFP